MLEYMRHRAVSDQLERDSIPDSLDQTNLIHIIIDTNLYIDPPDDTDNAR